MRWFFAVLSIDMFVFFTRYSLRYLSLKLNIPSIKLLSFCVIICQDSLEVSPCILIVSYLVGFLPYGPFPWKR